MALQTSVNQRNYIDNEYDEEIEETEDDLIENYLYLTSRCGVLRHSPTTSVLDKIQQQQQQQQHKTQSVLSRQYSLTTDNHHQLNFERSRYHSTNDFNNNHHTYDSTISRVPATIYFNSTDDDYDEKSFSLVKLFARMKARLKHDQRYRPRSTHELLYEEDPQEWLELTKNVRNVLTQALLPDGGYDALVRKNKTSHSRKNSKKKSRDYHPVSSKEIENDEDKITVDIDEEFNTEGDEEYDEIIWKKFLDSPRGSKYRRCGVCKAVDRQQFQGQLVYIYGVANNILIDENLKASGLG